jgi:hypothetical protein
VQRGAHAAVQGAGNAEEAAQASQTRQQRHVFVAAVALELCGVRATTLTLFCCEKKTATDAQSTPLHCPLCTFDLKNAT